MSRNRPLVPGAREALNHFEGRVMREEGYHVDQSNPKNVKYEVASAQNIPLDKGDNGQLTAKQAGTVGGNIGGKMVQEMIKMAKQSLAEK